MISRYHDRLDRVLTTCIAGGLMFTKTKAGKDELNISDFRLGLHLDRGTWGNGWPCGYQGTDMCMCMGMSSR